VHMNTNNIPPVAELFTLRQLAARHPTLLPENRLRWAVRQRERNGLEKAGAVFESPVGELIFHEPAMIAWILGLSGRGKPRALRRPAA
jgi:hypothetical protein